MKVRETSTAPALRRPPGAVNSVTAGKIQTNDELKTAAEYQPLIIHYNTTARRYAAGDVASVTDSVQDVVTPG